MTLRIARPRRTSLGIGAVFAAVPFATLLGIACGGSDFLDAADASLDGSTPNDANVDTADARTSDAATSDAEAGRPDADAGVADADAGQPDAGQDADAAPFDSGTGSLMQSLLTAEPFVVLGGATVTNSGIDTVLIGDVGTTGPSVVGLVGPPFQPSGSTEVNNARAMQALLHVDAAYGTLTGRACPPANDLTGMDLGGRTLAPGVYCFTSTAGQIAGTTLTFDAKGDPNAVWIIQVATGITIMDNAKAVIIGGPPSLGCRVFWTAGTAVTINGGAEMVGNFLASSATTMLGNAKIVPGRAFGVTAGVTLLSNTVSAAVCLP